MLASGAGASPAERQKLPPYERLTGLANHERHRRSPRRSSSGAGDPPAADPGPVPIVLVHGAANSAAVWTFWREALATGGWSVHPMNLRGHGDGPPADLAVTAMADYVADVVAFARALGPPLVLIGWSMGGLVAMMAAASISASACVALAPSAPARTVDRRRPLRRGMFGPEEYGIVSRDPSLQPAMPDLDLEERGVALAALGPESRLARDERSAGIVVEPLPCPLLIVTGTADTQWPRARYADLPFDADYVEIDGASHWGLVLSRRTLRTLIPTVTAWLRHAARA